MPRLPRPCRHLTFIERRVRAIVLHWLVTAAVIDDSREAARLDERQLTDLDEAIRRARNAGR